MKVPVYDAPQAETKPLNAPNLSVNYSPLGQAGSGLEQLGGQLTQDQNQVVAFAQKENDKANALAITNAETQYQAFTNQQTEQLRAQKGQDALLWSSGGQGADDASGTYGGAPSPYEANEQQRQKLADSITNPEARAHFDARTRGLQEDFHHSSEMYIGAQLDQAKEASTQGSQAVALDSLANNYADPASREKFMAMPEQPIRALALSPEDAEAKVAQWRAKAHSTVLNQYIANQDWQGAQAYFAQSKSELGNQSAQYEHTIQTLKSKTIGDQTALAAVNAARLPNGFVDTTKAIAPIEAMPPGPDKEMAEEHLSKYLTLEKAAESNQKAQIFDQGFTAVLKNRSLADVPAPVKAWLVQNDPEGWQKLQQVAQSWQKDDTKPTQQNTANYVGILTDMEQNQAKFRGMNAGQFAALAAPLLTPEQFKQVGEKFAALQGKPEKDVKLTTAAEKITSDVTMTAFGETSTKSSEWTPQHVSAYAYVHDKLVDYATQYARDHNGKTAPLQELEAEANNYLVKGKVKGSGWFIDSTATRAEAETNPNYVGKSFVPSGAPPAPALEPIPPDMDKKIREGMRAKSTAPTDALVRDSYERYKKKTGGK